MPLGDNVQSISDRQPAGRRRVAPVAPSTEPAPYDNLLRLATEIEEREARARRPHLAPVPSTPSRREAPPPPPPPAPPVPAAPPAPVPVVAPARRYDRALLVVAGALVVAIGVLLIWGTDIERLMRPGIGDRSESVETAGGDDATGDPVPPEEGSLAPAQSSTSVAPSTSTTPNDGAAGTAGVQEPSTSVAPAVANCDATSVWPTIAALNDVSPIAVAWVTCSERYATAGLVPADAPPESPPSVIVTLRSDGGAWALLSVGEPAACAPGASAVDPAFPTSLCP